MTENYRKFRKGPRMRTRRTHQAVTSEKDFNGRRDHEATLALNPGPRRRDQRQRKFGAKCEKDSM